MAAEEYATKARLPLYRRRIERELIETSHTVEYRKKVGNPLERKTTESTSNNLMLRDWEIE